MKFKSASGRRARLFGRAKLGKFVTSSVFLAGIAGLTGQDLYDLDTGLRSRSISFENPTGAPGEGGKAASRLGPGRKGSPNRVIRPGETVTLCDIQGSGTIRHIWMTGRFGPNNSLLRAIVVRVWWDGQEHPSIECPLGDFMGVAHGQVAAYQSAVHSVGDKAALNLWMPMPFRERARMTFSNESTNRTTLYYQIDYTLEDKHPRDVGRLHALFRRENPTRLKEDFELLPQRKGKGRFLGALIGVRSLHPNWWGEGEIKIYMDGDKDYATIVGTGSEDYVCLSYGVQETPYLYHGCVLNREQYITAYRWHIPDPVYWQKECRITIQQIGYDSKGGGLYERQDDWSTATFWYEPVPSEPLPALPRLVERMANLPKAPAPVTANAPAAGAN